MQRREEAHHLLRSDTVDLWNAHTRTHTHTHLWHIGTLPQVTLHQLSIGVFNITFNIHPHSNTTAKHMPYSTMEAWCMKGSSWPTGTEICHVCLIL